MDTSKATARPWKRNGRYIEIGNGLIVARIDGDVPMDVNYANAALIVRAVNSHEAMVAALRDLLDGTEPWDERATQARAALALAEQGGG